MRADSIQRKEAQYRVMFQGGRFVDVTAENDKGARTAATAQTNGDFGSATLAIIDPPPVPNRCCDCRRYMAADYLPRRCPECKSDKNWSDFVPSKSDGDPGV